MSHLWRDKEVLTPEAAQVAEERPNLDRVDILNFGARVPSLRKLQVERATRGIRRASVTLLVLRGGSGGKGNTPRVSKTGLRRKGRTVRGDGCSQYMLRRHAYIEARPRLTTTV